MYHLRNAGSTIEFVDDEKLFIPVDKMMWVIVTLWELSSDWPSPSYVESYLFMIKYK